MDKASHYNKAPLKKPERKYFCATHVQLFPKAGKDCGRPYPNNLFILVQIEKDSLTKTARKNWSEGATGTPGFKPGLVAAIYRDELQGSKLEPPKLRRIMLLEISQYLENYLIPNCTQVRTWPFSVSATMSGIALSMECSFCGFMTFQEF
jgi:hypothetical protein